MSTSYISLRVGCAAPVSLRFQHFGNGWHGWNENLSDRGEPARWNFPLVQYQSRWDAPQNVLSSEVHLGGVRQIGIEGGQRKRHCLERSPVDVDENVLVDLYLLGADVGPFWPQVRRNF